MSSNLHEYFPPPFLFSSDELYAKCTALLRSYTNLDMFGMWKASPSQSCLHSSPRPGVASSFVHCSCIRTSESILWQIDLRIRRKGRASLEIFRGCESKPLDLRLLPTVSALHVSLRQEVEGYDNR